MKLRFRKTTDTAQAPRYMTDGAAGMDLCYDGDRLTLYQDEQTKVSTGIAVEIPHGHAGLVCTRSGLACVGVVVANSPGVVDEDYRGPVCVVLINHGSEPHTIDRGDRIAQMVISPVVRVELKEVEELGDTARGSGGFGSTGTK